MRVVHPDLSRAGTEASQGGAGAGRRPLQRVPGVRGGVPDGDAGTGGICRGSERSDGTARGRGTSGGDRSRPLTRPRTVHPIEAESMRRLRRMLDLSHLPDGSRAVVERVVHASADPEYAETMVVPEEAVEAGVRALKGGCAVVTDVEMTLAGLHGEVRTRASCYLRRARLSDQQPGATLSAQAMAMAGAEHPRGAMFVVGCAPTALERLLSDIRLGLVQPALVVGLPVGFVGAAEAKAALAASGVPFVTNSGAKGGSAVAAAAVNALYRLSLDGADPIAADGRVTGDGGLTVNGGLVADGRLTDDGRPTGTGL